MYVRFALLISMLVAMPVHADTLSSVPFAEPDLRRALRLRVGEVANLISVESTKPGWVLLRYQDKSREVRIVGKTQASALRAISLSAQDLVLGDEPLVMKEGDFGESRSDSEVFLVDDRVREKAEVAPVAPPKGALRTSLRDFKIGGAGRTPTMGREWPEIRVSARIGIAEDSVDNAIPLRTARLRLSFGQRGYSVGIALEQIALREPQDTEDRRVVGYSAYPIRLGAGYQWKHLALQGDVFVAGFAAESEMSSAPSTGTRVSDTYYGMGVDLEGHVPLYSGVSLTVSAGLDLQTSRPLKMDFGATNTYPVALKTGLGLAWHVR